MTAATFRSPRYTADGESRPNRCTWCGSETADRHGEAPEWAYGHRSGCPRGTIDGLRAKIPAGLGIAYYGDENYMTFSDRGTRVAERYVYVVDLAQEGYRPPRRKYTVTGSTLVVVDWSPPNRSPRVYPNLRGSWLYRADDRYTTAPAGYVDAIAAEVRGFLWSIPIEVHRYRAQRSRVGSATAEVNRIRGELERAERDLARLAGLPADVAYAEVHGEYVPGEVTS